MEVILKRAIKGLGQKDDLVQVKPGYGRNYLIPHGLVLFADSATKKDWQERKRQTKHKKGHILDQAKVTADRIRGLTLQIFTRANNEGNIYGAITAIQIAKALEKQGIVVDRASISFKENIRTIGKYQVDLDLHSELQIELQVEVLQESGS